MDRDKCKQSAVITAIFDGIRSDQLENEKKDNPSKGNITMDGEYLSERNIQDGENVVLDGGALTVVESVNIQETDSDVYLTMQGKRFSA